MAEQTNDTAITPDQTNNVQEAQALNEMSVKLAKLEAENKDLLNAKRQYYDSILNGVTIEENAPEYRSAEDIRDELRKTGKDNTNLKNAELYVELNDAVLREGGDSIFLPKGKGITPTYEEQELATRFPSVLKECIETAQGNSDVFNSELKRRTRK